MILCQLAETDMTVGELVTALDLPQPTVSQHLARLKSEGILDAQRSGTLVRYSILRTEILPIIDALYAVFCNTDDANP